MGPVVPILFVVIFWMIVGVFAVGLFRRWLSVPTETEVEVAHEHARHEADVRTGKVEQTAAH